MTTPAGQGYHGSGYGFLGCECLLKPGCDVQTVMYRVLEFGVVSGPVAMVEVPEWGLGAQVQHWSPGDGVLGLGGGERTGQGKHLRLISDSTLPKSKRSEAQYVAIQNLHSFNPFTDASKGDDLLPAATEDYIYLRIQQRNGRKTLTTVQGIADYYEKKLVKAFKKKFTCNGTVIEHQEYGEVIQLQGDQRKNICQFLVEIGLAKDDQLKVHGF
ncbi:eukaryotic translation initiation factor 1-like [Nycticebus coucang]|uniref:eukaryotic translation initiation factor 1-like n=1 Tax=Nycticebus coucang TaxID=9470 RepID=UPI00234CB910|nr:eukaryotic translation initiation factor 1-like [Nycticebus coucang]